MAGAQRYYKLRPSGILTLFLFLFCMVSLLVLWQLPLPMPVLFVLSVAVSWWCGYRWMLDASLRLGHSCVAFRLENCEDVVLMQRNGRHLAGRVCADSLVISYFVILNVTPNGERRVRSLLILPDVMGGRSFRHLRVALRWGDKAIQAEK